MKLTTLFLIGFLLLFTGNFVYSEVTLPRVIGSNMVLQRDMQAPIWGWASAGEEISVTLSAEAEGVEPISTTTAVADAEGNWRTELPAMAAGGPYTLRVKGSNTLELTNVLFGEVWVCSGQSNMQWPVSASKDSEAEIAAGMYPKIRLFYVPRVPSGLLQQDVAADWYETTPETIPNFSAVAYYFGRKLYKNLDVPIGLINTSWGGTRIEPWTPPVGLDAVPALESISKEVQDVQANYREQLPEKMREIEAWIAETRKALETGAHLTQMPNNTHPLAHQGRPTALYNGMVHPILPYAIRGALWYQGESNLRDGMLYHEKMKALINGWREVWGQGDFPFYFVQLAPFNYGGRDASPFFLPQIWEAQAATLALPNTGMAVITDIGNLRDIHPRNKQEVGRRLALWALAKTYGREDVTHSGPLYKSMAVEGNAIRLTFDAVGSGLMAQDEKPLTWFEIAGEDKQFVEAQATIDGDTIRDASPFFLPQIWEAQAATLALPNTGMAVITDIGNLRDIHPRNKQEVGRRLALWALAKTYGREDVTHSGPLYKSMAVEGNAIRLTFDAVGSGLMAQDEKPLTWFEIAGEDKQFVEAQATIDGDTIIVSSEAVAKPVAARFGWHQSAEPNFVNKEGLPASPFRTDSW